ncbi:MAG TPA: response regulator [Deltaproteobacteria bacterium]|nr:response regulator [Deltaproteobacteria bacterium]
MAKGRILVMDDEELIRDVVSSMLEYLGYEVDLSSNGQQALQKYSEALQGEKRFDMVIMDLTIPGGKGGKEVIRELLELDPAVKAIVSSGYSNDPVMANYTEYGFKGVVNKPFKIEDLGKALEQVLTA